MVEYKVEEMLRFFGIMMRISMEPINMGGCVSYFVDNPMVNIGGFYYVCICGYITWEK